MRKIDGHQVGHGHVRFANLYVTDGGVLLNFGNRRTPWVGMFPGCSIDDYYDRVLPYLSGATPMQQVKTHVLPTLVLARRGEGQCEACLEETTYKYCTAKCWYDTMMRSADLRLETLVDRDEIFELERFKAVLETTFGSAVNETEDDPFGQHQERWFNGS